MELEQLELEPSLERLSSSEAVAVAVAVSSSHQLAYYTNYSSCFFSIHSTSTVYILYSIQLSLPHQIAEA